MGRKRIGISVVALALCLSVSASAENDRVDVRIAGEVVAVRGANPCILTIPKEGDSMVLEQTFRHHETTTYDFDTTEVIGASTVISSSTLISIAGEPFNKISPRAHYSIGNNSSNFGPTEDFAGFLSFPSDIPPAEGDSFAILRADTTVISDGEFDAWRDAVDDGVSDPFENLTEAFLAFEQAFEDGGVVKSYPDTFLFAQRTIDENLVEVFGRIATVTVTVSKTEVPEPPGMPASGPAALLLLMASLAVGTAWLISRRGNASG